MKKSISIAALMSMLILNQSAQADEVTTFGDIGMTSQYMWRGMQQTGSSSVQGDLGADFGNGLSASVWFASLNSNSTEFDFTVDFSGEAGGLSYSVGFIYYSYLNGASGNAGEVYVGVGYGPVSITYYNAVMANSGADGWKKDAYVDVALGHSVAGFDIGANLGFYLPDTTTAFPATKNELGHVDLSLSKGIKVGGAIMTPSIMVSVPTFSGKTVNSQVVAGVNFAY